MKIIILNQILSGQQNFNTMDDKHNYVFTTDYESLVFNIRTEFAKYVTEHKIKAVILGVSGGIDSALVAALVKPVCVDNNVTLIGRSLPTESNKDWEIVQAKNVGEFFCTDFMESNISPLYHTVDEQMDELLRHDIRWRAASSDETLKQSKIRLGNIKARLRMIYLYNLAKIHYGLVLSTDNYTEFLLSFFTRFGDEGDYAPIRQLWKTEVYGLAEYLAETEYKGTSGETALKQCISCMATDGLGITSSDLDQILPDWDQRHETTRSGYNEVDSILLEYVTTGGFNGTDEQQKVIDRHIGTSFKRNGTIEISRKSLLYLKY